MLADGAVFGRLNRRDVVGENGEQPCRAERP
jgi:hypothetical protein